MINFQIAKIDTIQMPIHFKGKEQSETENIERKNIALLDNPMETVGRSQVNFRGAKRLVKALAADELNMIAEYAVEHGLSRKEISVGKQALIDTTNEYKCTSAHKLAMKYDKMIDKEDYESAAIMKTSFIKNVFKIDSGVNADRVDFLNVLTHLDDWVKNNRALL